jgi:murein DD-endopeptidase MepM/ murein hydrolase activator NlpD
MRRGFQVEVDPKKPPTASPLHRTFRMKRLAKISALLTMTLLLFLISGAGGFVVEKLVFYGRIARLYTRQPDSRLAMPVQDVLKKQVANTWHAPRGTDRVHEGQDIFAPRGTPIFSATSGYVYRVGENNLGGQTVSVIGAGGRVYYYAHLDSYAPGIEEGDPVTTKTLLGYVGTTGNAQGTPPHLHFGIYTSSGAINPLPLLVDRTAPVLSNNKQLAKRTLVSRKA